jgi:Protein of unknown function (DUF3501)
MIVEKNFKAPRRLTPADILPLDAYNRVRDEKRRTITAMKKNRRMPVGPYATFMFENYDTVWLQVQEMLRIEKGGDAQLADELRAYNPLIPNGEELVATVMFGIDNPTLRQQVLSSIGGVENMMQIRLGGEKIIGTPECDLEYTSPEGKASSVLFVHFRFTLAQISLFRSPGTEVTVAVTHANYAHMAIMPQNVRSELARDFA